MSETLEQRLMLRNARGMHARAAMLFVQLAARFRAEVEVIKDGLVIDGKSVMAVLSLMAAAGTQITLRVCGEDAQAALAARAELVGRGCGEA